MVARPMRTGRGIEGSLGADTPRRAGASRVGAGPGSRTRSVTIDGMSLECCGAGRLRSPPGGGTRGRGRKLSVAPAAAGSVPAGLALGAATTGSSTTGAGGGGAATAAGGGTGAAGAAAGATYGVTDTSSRMIGGASAETGSRAEVRGEAHQQLHARFRA